jgi:hypothetical protein
MTKQQNFPGNFITTTKLFLKLLFHSFPHDRLRLRYLGLILSIVTTSACQSREVTTSPRQPEELEIKTAGITVLVAPPTNPCPIPQVKANKKALNEQLLEPRTPSKVEQEIKDIRQKALDMGIETAQGVGNKQERLAKAQLMERRRTKLYPLITCEPVSMHTELATLWADGGVYLGYVLSEGKELAPSDLYYYVQDLRKKNKENKEN